MSETGGHYSGEQISQLLTCSVCLDRYRSPKLLPCQHTFCLSPCLEGLIDPRTRMLRCPECRADHLVPRGGPSKFPNNLTIISFLGLPVVNTDGSAREPPPESQPSSRTGGSGLGNMGSLGSLGVFGGAGTPSGGVAPLEEAGAVGGGMVCAVCRFEGDLVHCGHCRQAVCEACCRSHIEQVKLDISRKITQIRRGLPHISELVQTIGHKGAQLQQRCEVAKAEVTELIEKHIRELKNRQRTLHDEVDAFLLSELRSLRGYQENYEVDLASIASFCDSTETALGRPMRSLSHADLLDARRQCLEHVQTVQNFEGGLVRPPNVKQLTIAAESQALTSATTNFGSIAISTVSSSFDSTGSITRQRDSSTNATSEPSDSRRTGRRQWQQSAAETTNAASDIQDTRRARRSWQQLSEDTSNSSTDFQDTRRTRHQWQQPTADLSLAVLGTHSPSLSPSLERRNTSPTRARRATTLALAEDEGGSDRSEYRFRPAIRRRPRAEHHSDTRLAVGFSVPLDLRARHRSMGALTSNSTQDGSLHESSPGLARDSTFVRESSPAESRGMSTSQLAPLPLRAPARGSLRFDVTLEGNEGGGGDAEEGARGPAGGTVMSFNRISSSPSMYIQTPRNHYNQKGQAVVRFGSRGSNTNQFTWPRGVAVSPLDDNIFVADSSNHRVQVFDCNGRFVHSFGSYGQNEGEFDCLAGIAVNGLGQVIIADRYNHRIQIFDRQGNFQSMFGEEGVGDGQLNYPWGVSCDNMGFVYVCDKENHRIQVFQSNGTFVRKFGRLGRAAGEFENPHYIAVSGDNNVYVSDSSNHRIQVFSIYGDFLFSFGVSGTLRGQIKYPRGIAIDNQGFVVVADSGNNRVQVFRADGRYYSMFGSWGSENGQFKGLEGVAILANGNVVVSDRENHRIQIF